jgi:tetratricopeptide (TPR) repeat protein
LRSNAVVPILIGLLLCASTFALAQAQPPATPQPTTPPDTVLKNDTLAVQVLEERIASLRRELDKETAERGSDKAAIMLLQETVSQNDWRTAMALDAIRRELDQEAREHRDDILDVRSEMGTHAWYLVGIITALGAGLTFFGYSRIKRWTRDRVNVTVGTEMEKRLKVLSSELEGQMGKTQKLYEDMRGRQGDLITGSSERYSEDDVARFAETEESLRAEKAQEEWSAEDWFYKGVSESKHGDFKAAIESYTQSIDIFEDASPSSEASFEYAQLLTTAYLNRGNRYAIKGDRRKAMFDFTRAIELAPESFMPRQSMAEVLVLEGEYEKARDAATEAISRAPDKGSQAISLYLKWICEVISGKGSDDTESLLNAAVQDTFESPWRLDEIETWLQTADIGAEKRDKIIKVTERLRTKHMTTMPYYFQ